MKKIAFIMLSILLLYAATFSQSDTTGIIRTEGQISDSLYVSLNTAVQDTAETSDSLLIPMAMKHIITASRLTNAGIFFGSLGYFTVLFNAGVAAREDGNEDASAVMILIGISSGTTRLSLSFVTPSHLRKAENLLLQAQAVRPDEVGLESSLRHIRIAKNASVAVPILGIAGFGLVAGSMVAWATDGSPLFLWIGGFLFATSSYTSTIVSRIHITKAKKLLTDDAGTLRVGLNSYGIGLSYRF